MAKKDVTTSLENWLSFTQEMNEMGVSFINYKISTKFIKPSSEVAARLRISQEKEVFRLDWARGEANGPFVWFISYFHPWIRLNGKED